MENPYVNYDPESHELDIAADKVFSLRWYHHAYLIGTKTVMLTAALSASLLLLEAASGRIDKDPLSIRLLPVNLGIIATGTLASLAGVAGNAVFERKREKVATDK